MSDDIFYRVATTQAGLETGANFYALELPKPDLVTFADFTQRFAQSQGGENRQGYINATLLWLRLHTAQAAVLRSFVETAEAGTGLLYWTLPRQDAKHGGVSWVDISARTALPNLTPAQGTLFVFENVQIKLNNITILATPSTVQS